MDMNYAAAAPEIFLGLAICVVLLADVFLRDDQRNVTYVLAMLALIGTSAVTLLFPVTSTVVTFSGSFVTDPASDVLKMFAYITMGVTFLYSREYLQNNGLLKGEFFVLGLFGLLGIMIMISAHSLLTLYLGLEVLALSQYTLVAFNRDSAASAEAAMKYFVLGAIASGVLLYGISLLYGITGTLQLDVLAQRVATAHVVDPRAARARVHRRGRRVQVRRRAVPHVAARRVPRRADARDVVHRLGAEDRVVRARVARADRRARARARRGLARHADRAERAVARDRQSRRDRADEPEAHARVLDDLARRLHPARVHRGHGRGRLGRDVLHVRVRADGRRRLRHDHPLEPARLRGRAARGLQGTQRAQPVVRARDADGHVQHGRRAAVHRLLRQARTCCSPR